MRKSAPVVGTAAVLIVPTILEQAGIIIPTYNAAAHFPALHAALKRQGLDPMQVLFVDSASTDGTAELVRRAGYALRQIKKKDFRHGSTRAAAVNYFPEARYLVFLTQDAIPRDHDSITTLLHAFEDPQVGAAYGRQIARAEAGPLERHARQFNYPPRSEVRDYSMRDRLGFRTAYHSNSFAAYRRTAMEAAGGFQNTIVSEEVSLVARMLLAGWKNAYVAEAQVIHSHSFTIPEEFSRYFDIGVHHGMERWIIDKFGDVGGEGQRFVRSELQYVWHEEPMLAPVVMMRTLMKWAGYRLGMHARRLPRPLVKALSGQRTFWEDEAAAENADKTRAATRST